MKHLFLLSLMSIGLIRGQSMAINELPTHHSKIMAFTGHPGGRREVDLIVTTIPREPEGPEASTTSIGPTGSKQTPWAVYVVHDPVTGLSVWGSREFAPSEDGQAFLRSFGSKTAVLIDGATMHSLTSNGRGGILFDKSSELHADGASASAWALRMAPKGRLLVPQPASDAFGSVLGRTMNIKPLLGLAFVSHRGERRMAVEFQSIDETDEGWRVEVSCSGEIVDPKNGEVKTLKSRGSIRLAKDMRPLGLSARLIPEDNQEAKPVQ